MTAFQDLNEFFNPGLVLPIGGVEYKIIPPSARYGLWLQQAVATGVALDLTPQDAHGQIVEKVAALGEPPDGKSLQELVLGDAYQQMQDNGVDILRIKHCSSTALVYLIMGEEAAARYWASPGEPGKASNRAARRATSNSTGAASGTRRRASTSGTSSRKT